VVVGISRVGCGVEAVVGRSREDCYHSIAIAITIVVVIAVLVMSDGYTVDDT
jgi:hypothetical protein